MQEEVRMPSLKRPPGRRWSEEEEEEGVGEFASSREDAPKNLIARTPKQVSQMQTVVPEACSPLWAQRIGTGNSGATQQKNDGAEYMCSRAKQKTSTPFIDMEDGRQRVEDEPERYEGVISYQ
jgi:hypothetical protein